MNKLVYKILLLAALPLLLWSCAESDVDQIRFDLDTSEVTLRNGDAGSTDILIASNFEHPIATVSADAREWLSAEVVQRCLTIIYTRNETDAERTGEVTVTAGSLVRTVTVTQPAWVAPREGYAVGDLIDEGLGVVYWVDPADARIAKAISVEHVTGIAWSTTTSLTNAISRTNGLENMELLNGSTFAAAYHCASLGEDWYLPARNELIEIFEIYNGTSYDDASNEQPAKLTEPETAARAAFDSLLEAAGGSPMNTAADNNNGNSYWSSTESDASMAWWVRFGKKGYEPISKTSTTRYIRCVKALGNYRHAADTVEITRPIKAITLEGAAQSSATSEEVTVLFGTLTAAEVESTAQSWLEATVTGSTVTVTALTDNTTGTTREATVTVTATPDDPEAAPATATLTVTQKPQLTEVKWKVGDLYPSDKPEGVIYWVSDDGQSARMVSLNRTEGGKWTNAASPIANDATSQTDGVDNTTKLLASTEAADIPALTGCTDGWYWPAITELEELDAAYKTFGEEAFDRILTGAGGTAINESDAANADRYWSSTETSATQVYYMRLGSSKNTKEAVSKTGNTARFARWIKQLGEGAQAPEKPSDSGPSEGDGDDDGDDEENEDTTYELYQLYKENGVVKGVVYWVSEDSKNAKVVSLNRSEGMKSWMTQDPSGELFGATSKSDGVTNTTTLLEKSSSSVIPGLEGCTDGWYWPAVDELYELDQFYKTDKTTLDKLLTANGGTELNKSDPSDADRYWSSSEYNATNVWWCRIGSTKDDTRGNDASKFGGSKDRFVRWIKQVGPDAKRP